MNSVQAQRPSFAGARPPGGLTQKDKYIGAQNTALENRTGVDIATRFGDSPSGQQTATPIITLPFGASQKPPVGVPLVLPTNSYVPLGTGINGNSIVSDFGVANRFGAADNNNSGVTFASSLTPGVVAVPAFSRPLAAVPASVAPAPAPSAAPAPANASSFSSSSPAQQLPIDAHGDRELINHLNQLPVEQRPFWLINYEAIEALRNSSRPNVGALQTRGSFFGR
ncbi:uncharacterized protein LOC6639235 [Drosophila willistoni]|uniref:uncharacterized protein LOC6639235 n=1 Tax=Drosophila willistoni TaxID=7260 RepID=UPI00017D6909|nr:uncharacterized protein LOC6639235 [Drosophila willistoni]